MAEKVKLTREQADAVDTLNKTAKGMKVVDLLRAIQEGYEVAEYKVGDWVVVTFVLHESIYGKTKKLTKVKKSHAAGHDVCYELDGGGVVYNNEIRHATPEEIKAEKERRLWKEIGRETNEFRVGDSVNLRNKVYRVAKNMGCDFYAQFVDIKHLEKLMKDDAIFGFYPAESFISFEDGVEG